MERRRIDMNDFTRRTAVQAAALVPFQAIRGSAQNSAIRVGLIGAGSRGTYTSGTVAKDPRAKITAICDVVPEQTQKAKEKIGATDAKLSTNLSEVLSSKDVDAVIIA